MSNFSELALQDPVGELGIGRGIRGLGRIWAASVAAAILIGVMLSSLLAVLAFLAATAFIGQKLWHLFLAKGPRE